MHRNLSNLARLLTLLISGMGWIAADLCGQELRPTEKQPQQAAPLLDNTNTVNPGFVLVHAPGSISRFKANPSRVAKAFNQGFMRWAGKPSTAEAWKTLVQTGERIGIRINTSGGSITSSHPSLIEAIIDGLVQAGIPPKDIIVWDKYPHHMVSAGFVPMQPDNQWQCKSTVEGSGWDPKTFYFQEAVGRLIWGDYEFKGSAALPTLTGEGKDDAEADKDAEKQISNRSYFSNILTQEVDKVINIPSMTSHSGVGLLGCLSSLALGSVDNHRRFLDGSTASAQAIAEILKHKVIADKVIFHVLDGLVMQYAGGPAFDPNHADSTGFILMGQDPVAIDSWALQQMEYRREDTSVVAIGKKADHIQAARAHGLGQHFEETTITEVKIAP